MIPLRPPLRHRLRRLRARANNRVNWPLATVKRLLQHRRQVERPTVPPASDQRKCQRPFLRCVAGSTDTPSQRMHIGITSSGSCRRFSIRATAGFNFVIRFSVVDVVSEHHSGSPYCSRILRALLRREGQMRLGIGTIHLQKHVASRPVFSRIARGSVAMCHSQVTSTEPTRVSYQTSTILVALNSRFSQRMPVADSASFVVKGYPRGFATTLAVPNR